MTRRESEPTSPQSGGVDRRHFLRTAVAIGGASALSACLEREDPKDVPTGRTNENVQESEDTGETEEYEEQEGEPVPGPDPADRSVSQHAWVEYLPRSDKDVPLNPRHHLLLHFDYVGDDIEFDREIVESSLTALEEAYEWSSEGLLFTIGYSAHYFQEYDGSIPEGLEKPKNISPVENPEMDTVDVCLHLASDNAHVVLAVEEAVKGEVSEVGGRMVDADMSSVFELQDRRTGFVGEGLPADNQDVEGIPSGEPVPEKAPLFMGQETFHGLQEFHPDYDPEVTKVHNQARESTVTISEGPFKGGTTQHVSKIRLDLEDWYGDLDAGDRLSRMLEPGAGEDLDFLGERGQNAEEGTRWDKDKMMERLEDNDLAAHADKIARARVDMEPRILRRDFNSTDGGHARLHFVSLQEEIKDFVVTRQMMDGQDLAAEYDEIGEIENNGILEFIGVERRGNYLVPPQSKRALPLTSN